MKKHAIIVAGGTGTRMGTEVPKQLLPLNGKPLMFHTLGKFLDFDADLTIALVLHESVVKEFSRLSEEIFNDTERNRIIKIKGGESRAESVANGLRGLAKMAVHPDSLIAIHDAVRPFISKKIIGDAFRLASEKGSAVTCVPVKSSIRMKTTDGSKAVERSNFFHVQTPQVFIFSEIRDCYEKRKHDNYTDDASLAEEFGIPLHICEGSYDNIKVTTPEDMSVAKILFKKENQGI